MQTVNSMFSECAARFSGRTAIRFEGRSMTYSQLDALSDKKAAYLSSFGLAPGMFAGVVMQHSPGMIADILAIIKCGAAYVPMEPAFPVQRIKYIVKSAGIKTVFTENRFCGSFDSDTFCITEDTDISLKDPSLPKTQPDEHDALYVLYTSGTTGKPKGVVAEHHNVCNYVQAFRDEFSLNENDRVLQNSVCTFDIFVEEVFPVLLSGGTLVIADEKERNSPADLADLMVREKVTVVTGFPYLISDLSSCRLPSSLRLAISGGDTLRFEHVKNFPDGTVIYNTYGPTETTVCCTYYRFDGQRRDTATVPVGKQIKGTSVYVVKPDMTLCSPGETGEIAIGGNGVTRGYLNDRKATEKQFIKDPFAAGGSRMYLSGDIGKVLSDGNIEFIKRNDDQVMIGGKRVEPLEVENVMYSCPGIDSAVVKPFKDTDGYPYLVCYYSSSDETDNASIKAHMRDYLPDFMIPEYFVRLSEIPRTASGKIDRNHLPEVKRDENRQ
jgi:D-alanine--poly(phosphoribitol) ligase subunit 1